VKRRLPLVLLVAACAGGPPIALRDAYSYEPVLGDVGAVYFTVENRGGTADTLTAVEVDGALVAMLHEQVGQGERVEMRHLGSLVLPAHTSATLKPGGMHVMVEGFTRPPVAGDTLLMTVRFAKAGPVQVRAAVLAYGREP
jgi:periplasmic copper chaperone A